MDKIRAIIVENDLAFLDSFTAMITRLPEILLVDVFSDVDTAQNEIPRLQPDLVFLDIRLNGGDAFDLLSGLEEIKFDIVFTTAYDEYALKAIELSALHYLLKPFGMEELTEVISRMNRKRKTEILVQTLLSNLSQENNQEYRIALKTMEGTTIAELAEILYCQADNNYTIFHLKNGQKLMVSHTIKKYDDLLSERSFLRIHQSYLVNLKSIKKLIKADGGSVELKNGIVLPVSRRKREELELAIERMVLS